MIFVKNVSLAALLLSLPLLTGCQMQPDIIEPEPIWFTMADKDLPAARWDHLPSGKIWTRHAMFELMSGAGQPLAEMMPKDIEKWCPSYGTMQVIFTEGGGGQFSTLETVSFWVGLLSVMAKNESGYNPQAVGRGGKRYGLLQISPAVATKNKCTAATGEALKDPVANISCAIRIMTKAVPRDGVVAAGGRGVAADWAVLRSSGKRAAMQKWLSKQEYCQEEAY